jgi:thiol-disulfide isomerase/thioredoxin
MPPGRRKALAYLGVGAAAAAAGAVLGPLWLQKQSGAASLLGMVFPDLRGQARRLMEWKGKVAVVNFWATWCEPCREEIPLLIDVSRKYAQSGVEVVGIAIDTVAKIREFAANYKISYETLVGDARALDLLRVLGNTAGALPYSVILDRSGAVASRKLGAYRAGELEGLLAGMLR